MGSPLSDTQLSSLYQDCIRLNLTNRIKQSNAFTLDLIDHMPDIILRTHKNGQYCNESNTSNGSVVIPNEYRDNRTHRIPFQYELQSPHSTQHINSNSSGSENNQTEVTTARALALSRKDVTG